MTIPAAQLLKTLPPEWPEDLLPRIRERLRQSGKTIVVLDDDPTGTQTVYDLPILTEWTVDTLAAEFKQGTPVFYILTNSRSLSEPQAAALAREIGGNLRHAADRTGRRFLVISRSDSTLRGHYPAEVDALADALDMTGAVQIIAPFFLEGGRLTINDTHYVLEEEHLVPAAETPFAQDAVFGYSQSNLQRWVEEKTGGRVSADAVRSITLDDIRTGGPDRITQRLRECRPSGVCIINAAAYRDLEVVVTAMQRLEGEGRTFLCRTAASFVRICGGLAEKPLLEDSDLHLPASGGGLILVGSHIARSSRQLEYLLQAGVCTGLEMQVERVLSEQCGEEIARIASESDRLLSGHQNVVAHTSRTLVTGSNDAENLHIGRQVSDALVAVVRSITIRPRYVLAKGGITSSDIATRGYGVKRAQVLGQILPGVPVWRFGPESRLPDLTYIVFPGNVGGPDAVTDVVRICAK